MSEEVVTQTVEAADPFNGQEPTFDELSAYRLEGKLAERFQSATEQKTETPAVAEKQAETAEGKEPSPEQVQERDETGKFKAKEPIFSEDQQKIFDKAFAKREAKLRREFEERIAAIESSKTQATPPAKEAKKEAAEPQPPELPDIATFEGTVEEYNKLRKEFPAKMEAYLEAKRQAQESQKTLQQKLADSEAKTKQAHPDFQEKFDELLADVKSGEEEALPQHVLQAIAQDADDPHGITYHLATNREEYQRFLSLSPREALREVLKLDVKLQSAPKAPAQEKKKATNAPPPPDPVGARAVTSAFDVNDDKMTADEWAAKRNEQRRKAGHVI